MHNSFSSKRPWRWILIAAFLVLLSVPAGAQTDADRSYFYEQIGATLTVRPDSTVQVQERLTFSFSGSFHSAWRSISLDGLSAITDVTVLDGTTLAPLTPAHRRLDKLEPTSWGKYAIWREGGSMNAEWYYDLADTSHTWIITYVAHGAISFGDTQDRLYWDVFTDYDVPVGGASAAVILPAPVEAENVVAVAYTTATPRIAGTYDAGTGTAEFSAQGFQAQEAFTIDVGFPPGLVSRAAFWRDWFSLFWGWLAGLAIAVITAVAIFLRWYITEKRPQGRGTVIPQYEPPQKLRPAMAEIICKVHLTNRGLSATVVDLAIRGYLKIEEDFGTNWLGKLGGKHYRLVKQREFSANGELEDYERQYLGLLFEQGDSFSTRAVKHWSDSKKQALHRLIQDLKRNVLKETELDTGAYLTRPSAEHKAYGLGLLAVFLIMVAGSFTLASLPAHAQQTGIALLALTISGVILWLYVRYEARLTHEGRILKEDWLGFKMFLHTAERYRMQNLTPATFEKFLPYAMVFGIEDDWAKAFDSVHLPPPNWYAGAAGAGLVSGSGGGFSASAFSASFSSSFGSAFSSSPGSSAGGGGSGGGAGGGGGGAG